MGVDYVFEIQGSTWKIEKNRAKGANALSIPLCCPKCRKCHKLWQKMLKNASKGIKNAKIEEM